MSNVLRDPTGIRPNSGTMDKHLSSISRAGSGPQDVHGVHHRTNADAPACKLGTRRSGTIRLDAQVSSLSASASAAIDVAG